MAGPESRPWLRSREAFGLHNDRSNESGFADVPRFGWSAERPSQRRIQGLSSRTQTPGRIPLTQLTGMSTAKVKCLELTVGSSGLTEQLPSFENCESSGTLVDHSY